MSIYRAASYYVLSFLLSVLCGTGGLRKSAVLSDPSLSLPVILLIEPYVGTFTCLASLNFLCLEGVKSRNDWNSISWLHLDGPKLMKKIESFHWVVTTQMNVSLVHWWIQAIAFSTTWEIGGNGHTFYQYSVTSLNQF